jgi:isoleucyl-tRNA synthetase
LRRSKEIGSSLEAKIELVVADGRDQFAIEEMDFAEICIVSELSVTSEARDYPQDSEFREAWVGIEKTTNHKCGRCWRLLPEVTEDGGLCARCEDVVNG